MITLDLVSSVTISTRKKQKNRDREIERDREKERPREKNRHRGQRRQRWREKERKRVRDKERHRDREIKRQREETASGLSSGKRKGALPGPYALVREVWGEIWGFPFSFLYKETRARGWGQREQEKRPVSVPVSGSAEPHCMSP